jgi:hypothetical protein
MNTRWRTRVAALILLTVVGCGKGKGAVEGTVSYKGELIPWGRITFVCEGGNKPARTSKIINGKYLVTDCPVGAARISVESFAVPDRGKQASGKDITKGFGPPSGDEIPPLELAGKHVKIPPEFSNPETSHLEYTIVPGKQSHDVELPR